MRTQEQVVERIKEVQGRDALGFQREVLYPYLDFDKAKQFLKTGAEKEQWEIDGVPLSPLDERIKADLERYMTYAWDKVENHRGISAGRSIDKMCAFLWLLEDDELVGKIEREEIPYAQYGAPILAVICVKYGFAVPSGETFANMVSGKPCSSECSDGCSL